MMIFYKYNTKHKIIFSKKHKIIVKFFQKPVRNINMCVGWFLLNNNQSLVENKITFNFLKITPNRVAEITHLNKKIIV